MLFLRDCRDKSRRAFQNFEKIGFNLTEWFICFWEVMSCGPQIMLKAGDITKTQLGLGGSTEQIPKYQVFDLVSGQLHPRKIAPWMISPRITAPEDNCPRIIPPWMIGPQIIAPGQFPPRIIVSKKNYPRTIAPEDNCRPENCPLTVKFPPKTITPTQVNSP